MKKIFFLLCCVLIYAPVWAAAPAESQFAAALERAAVAAARAQQTQAEEPYTGFDPHLSIYERERIPVFLQIIRNRLNNMGYRFTTSDEVEGLLMYAECSCNLVFTPETVVEWEDADGWTHEKIVHLTLSPIGVLRKHAIRYAFAKLLLPYAPQAFVYNPADFPPVKDWKQFHTLCQDEMIYIYVLMEEVQDGTEEELYEVFGNIL